MSDLAHGMWAFTIAAVAIAAAVAAVAWIRLLQRRAELIDGRKKAVEVLTKRFEDVEKTVSHIKTEWVNHKTVLGTKR